MEHRLSRPYQSGLGEPLHAYVRIVINGWRTESQEGRLEQKLYLTSLLHEPRKSTLTFSQVLPSVGTNIFHLDRPVPFLRP